MDAIRPRVIDNDQGEITVEMEGKELRGWSYADDNERRTKMLCAREYVEGWHDGRPPETEQSGDLPIPPVTMAQTMSILANTVHSVILANFIKPEDEESDKVIMTYICLAVFLHQLCCDAKHKDKMVGILQAVISELQAGNAEAAP